MPTQKQMQRQTVIVNIGDTKKSKKKKSRKNRKEKKQNFIDSDYRSIFRPQIVLQPNFTNSSMGYDMNLFNRLSSALDQKYAEKTNKIESMIEQLAISYGEAARNGLSQPSENVYDKAIGSEWNVDKSTEAKPEVQEQSTTYEDPDPFIPADQFTESDKDLIKHYRKFREDNIKRFKEREVQKGTPLKEIKSKIRQALPHLGKGAAKSQLQMVKEVMEIPDPMLEDQNPFIKKDKVARTPFSYNPPPLNIEDVPRRGQGVQPTDLLNIFDSDF